MFISMSQELKEEGNKLFQKRDHEGAMLKYEKAVKLLAKTHIDVAYLRSNMAACYMQMGLGEYPRAIHGYNLALQVLPKYSKALLKRAKCYEALNRLDFAFRDVHYVLSMEPNNLSTLEISESVKNTMIEKGIDIDEKIKEIGFPDSVEAHGAVHLRKVVKEKLKKKKNIGHSEEKNVDDKAIVEEKVRDIKDKEVVPKIVEEEKQVTKVVNKEVKAVTKTVKLVFGEDIRWAQLPVNCDMRLLRGIVRDMFPNLKAVLVKYRDPEGDLVTITTTDELWLVELVGASQGSLRFYTAELSSATFASAATFRAETRVFCSNTFIQEARRELTKKQLCSSWVLQKTNRCVWCEGCQKNDEECNLRYVLTVNVSDGSGEAWISMFNNEAEKILGCSAEELEKSKSQVVCDSQTESCSGSRLQESENQVSLEFSILLFREVWKLAAGGDHFAVLTDAYSR